MNKITPRYYQNEFYEATIDAWANQGYWDDATQKWSEERVPYASCCPASGKSLMLAMLSEWALNRGGRVIQLVPKLEHVKQNYNELIGYTAHNTDIGICCSKLKKFQTSRQCVIATASSFMSRRANSGAFNVCLIDELHNVSNDPNSRYRKIITSLRRQNPRMLITGVSGTCYRMGQGYIHNDCVKGKALFTDMVYETEIPRMIAEGYLSHIENISGDIHVNTDELKLAGYDYDTTAMAVKFDAICDDAVKDLKAKCEAYNIQTGIIFASNVANAEKIAELWGNDEIKVLHGGIKDKERDSILKWLETGSGRRIVVNPNILCEGYDFKALDLVCLMRSTTSLGLYVQMVCRVIRAFETKKVGYLCDFGMNIERHGSLDSLNEPKQRKRKGDIPKKLCDSILELDFIDDDGYLHKQGSHCNTLNILSAKKCKLCGAHFVSDDETGGYSMRSYSQILKDKEDSKRTEHPVSSVEFEIAISGKTGIKMIKMNLYNDASVEIVSKYLCLDHKGTAQTISKSFLRKMFKNQSDYYKLGAVGVNVDNMYQLLSDKDMYANFFKKISGVVIAPQKDSPRHSEIKNLIFEV